MFGAASLSAHYNADEFFGGLDPYRVIRLALRSVSLLAGLVWSSLSVS